MNCPTCGRIVLRANDGADWFCRHCWLSIPAQEAAQIPPAARKAPQKADETAYRGKEAALVADIVRALRARGRTVLRVGQFRANKAGSDCGVPDLLVADGAGRFIGLECKTATGRLSPAQRALAGAGMVRVVKSVSEAIEAVTEESTA